jgi:hypothetical protein
MQRRQRRIEIAINVCIILGCVVLLLVAALLVFEIIETQAAMDSAHETLARARQVNAECDALLKEVAPWRK